MKRKHIILYFLLQVLTLNACVLIGAALFPLLWTYVNTALLILVLPIASGFLVGHIVGSKLGDADRQEKITAANGLIGILGSVMVGVAVHNGGMHVVRSLTHGPVTDIAPSDTVEIERAGFLELKDARLLDKFTRGNVEQRTTSHAPHDGEAMHHTDQFTVVPVVDTVYREGDPVAVWLCRSTMSHSDAEGKWSNTSTYGDYGEGSELATISGVPIRNRWTLSRYRKAADTAVEELGLSEASRTHFIQYVGGFAGWRRGQYRVVIIILIIGNVLLVLTPTLIYPFAFRARQVDQE